MITAKKSTQVGSKLGPNKSCSIYVCRCTKSSTVPRLACCNKYSSGEYNSCRYSTGMGAGRCMHGTPSGNAIFQSLPRTPHPPLFGRRGDPSRGLRIRPCLAAGRDWKTASDIPRRAMCPRHPTMGGDGHAWRAPARSRRRLCLQGHRRGAPRTGPGWKLQLELRTMTIQAPVALSRARQHSAVVDVRAARPSNGPLPTGRGDTHSELNGALIPHKKCSVMFEKEARV